MNRVGIAPIHGIRQNALAFTMLIAVNLFVGSMVGMERTILPLIGEEEFQLASASATLSFIISFGFSKAIVNYFAGALAERFGRKKVLLTGWMIGFLVPLLVIFAQYWWVIVVANIFLGVNQALTWSMTVNMKIDLVKPNERGLAIGLNEAAGYIGLSAAAAISGYVASIYSYRPEPFILGLGFAFIGFILSIGVKSTEAYLSLQRVSSIQPVYHSKGTIFKMVTWRNRTLSSCSIAGMATDLKDGLAWGLFPLFLSDRGLNIGEIGLVVSVYPTTWGAFQLVTGYMSDRWGRKPLIVTGMILQAIALIWIACSDALGEWIIGAFALGLGTALVYPTLQASISDVAEPTWRASAMGVYRFWRDCGYAFGALLAGLIADIVSPQWTIAILASIPLAAAFQSMIRMKETLMSEDENIHRMGTV
ncbi:MFS transporter [Cohnella suwonensis]|uniref:MFS transporter n=1 Tax=Cohnella suwonensis TaxID=696072 RepID=A0ABW0LZK6_9BACL